MFGNALFGDWLIKLGAFAVGFNSVQLARIERQMPNVRKLITAGTKLAPLVDQMTPIINEALPLIDDAAKELKDLGPVLNMVLDVIERDMNAGKTRTDAINGIVNKITNFKL